MSGHEKFYIPHDDLLELKDSMDTLDTSISTLTAALKELNARLPLAGEELRVWVSGEDISGTGMVALYDEVLDATYDCFLRRVTLHGQADAEPFLARGEGMELRLGPELTAIWRKSLGRPNLVPRGTGAIWRVANTWDLNGVRIPAGTSFEVAIYSHLLTNFSYIVVTIAYAKALAE